MKKRNMIFGLFLSSGLVVTGATALFINADNVVEVKADSAVNNYFSYVYNDSFNNQNNNLTLFVFEGTATGLTADYHVPETNKVKINNVGLDELGGSVSIWNGHNWMQITYPTSSVFEGATLEIESGIVAGDAVFCSASYVMDANLKWNFAGFDEPITATYHSIPYAAFNNNKELLVRYSGSANMPSNITTTNKSIHNFDNYVTLNGQPLSAADSGAVIRTWAEATTQPWLWFRFTGATAGDVLKVKSGFKFCNEVFDLMSFVYNGTEWVYTPYIEDEPLIQNSDFILFAPSDYHIGGPNTDWGFYTRTGEPFAELTGNKSFGIQFTYKTVDDGLGNFQFHFGNAQTNHTAMLISYYNKRVYVEQFKGVNNPDNLTNLTLTNIDLADGEEHLIETYVIKDSETTVQVIFGVDGLKLFKTPSLSIEGITEWDYLSLQSLDRNCTQKLIIGSSATTTTEAIERFYTHRLASPVGSTWLEKYTYAKEYYDNYLNSAQRTALSTFSTYDYAYRAYMMLKAEADTEALNTRKATAKAELEDYVDGNTYLQEDQAEVDQLISTGKGLIDDATTLDDVEEIVTTYKDSLDAVPTESERKTAAKTELENYKDPNDYYPDEQQDIADIVALGKTQIDACTTVSDVNFVLAGAKGNLDNLQTKDQKDLAANKAAAIEELNAIDAQNYYPDQRMQVNTIRNQAIEDIRDATTGAQVTSIKEQALADIAAIPTILQVEIANAKAELASYVNLDDYRSDDQTRINNILTNAYAQLDRAESIDEINDIVAGNKSLLDDVPTDAERTAEELAEYKATKIAWLDEQKEALLPQYRAAEQQLINAGVAQAKTQIQNANNIAAVDQIIAGLLAQLEGLKTDAQYNQEESEEVIALISAIPSLTPANFAQKEAAVVAARTAYDKLGAGAKALVANYAALQAAETRLAQLKEESSAAANVDQLITAIGEVTLDSESAITAARAAYDALNGEAKGMVTKLNVLTAAEERLAQLKTAKAAAEEVEAKINAIGTVDATKACKDRVYDAYNSYQALSAEAKAMVSNKATLDSALEAFDNAVGRARQAALDEIESYFYSVNMKKYTEENQQELQRLYQEAYDTIQAQEYSDNLEQIVNDFEAAVEAIPQKKAPAKKAGCGGSIVATSVVLSTLALAGLGLAISKKRKED